MSGCYALRVNGDQVRDTWFYQPPRGVEGYRAGEVDDLLGRVAAELDAGRPAGPVIENSTLGTGKWTQRCDIDAVDWLVGQFLLPSPHSGVAAASSDPWRDLPVAQLAPGGVSGLAEIYPHYTPTAKESLDYFASQCTNAWRDFSQQPGMHLWWGQAGRLTELRTAERQTLASVRPTVGAEQQTVASVPPTIGAERQTPAFARRIVGLVRDQALRGVRPVVDRKTFSAGGRDFTYQRGLPVNGNSMPFANTWSSRWNIRLSWSQLADEAGVPVLYSSTIDNFDYHANSCIIFPGGQWFRFLVRGTRQANAIMTAVDQAGNKVARYRVLDKRLDPGRKTSFGLSHSIEITVHPGRKLTDELALALVISARWLKPYFIREGGGGP